MDDGIAGFGRWVGEWLASSSHGLVVFDLWGVIARAIEGFAKLKASKLCDESTPLFFLICFFFLQMIPWHESFLSDVGSLVSRSSSLYVRPIWRVLYSNSSISMVL